MLHYDRIEAGLQRQQVASRRDLGKLRHFGTGREIDESKHPREREFEANETPDSRSLKIRGGVKASHSAPWGWGLENGAELLGTQLTPTTPTCRELRARGRRNHGVRSSK